jgi:hypothetical protein
MIKSLSATTLNSNRFSNNQKLVQKKEEKFRKTELFLKKSKINE